MKQENVVLVKSYAFAVRIVRLCQYLTGKPGRLAPLINQVLRSGTSVGANLEEAMGGQSRRDFIGKCAIAYKEARETSYWLRLLRDTNQITPDQSASLLADCNELLRLLTAILRSTKENP